jgi:uncharacterized protein YoxC
MDMTTWLTILTTLMAAALCVQVVALVGIWRTMRELYTRVDSVSKDLVRGVGTMSAEVSQAVTTIKSVAEGVHALSGRLSAVAEIVYNRVEEVDAFLKETTDSARLEIARIQDAVENASRQIEQTFDLLHRGIFVPVKEVSAVLRGFRAGLDFIFRKPKGPSSASPQDEEMFIG